MIYKTIKNFDNYEVNECGIVRNKTTLKILNPCKVGNGYLQVSLCKNGKCYRKYIHRIVAETFINNPNNLKCVNHKNENKENNNVDNLEWCDYSYNTNYGTRNKRVSNILSKPVIQYDKSNNFIKEYSSISEASRINNISIRHISNCCNKSQRRKSAGGYIWEFQK